MGHFFRELTPQVLCIAFLVGVLGNLTASAVLGTPVLAHLHRKLNRQQRRQHGHVSAELAAMEERLKAHLDGQHEAVHARLDAIQQAQQPPKRRASRAAEDGP